MTAENISKLGDEIDIEELEHADDNLNIEFNDGLAVDESDIGVVAITKFDPYFDKASYEKFQTLSDPQSTDNNANENRTQNKDCSDKIELAPKYDQDRPSKFFLNVRSRGRLQQFTKSEIGLVAIPKFDPYFHKASYQNFLRLSDPQSTYNINEKVTPNKDSDRIELDRKHVQEDRPSKASLNNNSLESFEEVSKYEIHFVPRPKSDPYFDENGTPNKDCSDRMDEDPKYDQYHQPKISLNDNSMENFEEINKTAEITKLQQLVHAQYGHIAPTPCVSDHSSGQPFQCRICKNAFAAKGNLNRHLIAAHNEPPLSGTVHRCSICKKLFPSSVLLQFHIRYCRRNSSLQLTQFCISKNKPLPLISNKINEFNAENTNTPADFELGPNPQICNQANNPLQLLETDSQNISTTTAIENDSGVSPSKRCNAELECLTSPSMIMQTVPVNEHIFKEETFISRSTPGSSQRPAGKEIKELSTGGQSSNPTDQLFDATCKICYRSFPCQSVLEIHYQNHIQLE